MKFDDIWTKTPADEAMDNEAFQILEEVIDSLREREAIILRERFYNQKTYKEIGKMFNICGDRASQINKKALRKLRHPNRARKIAEAYGIEFFDYLQKNKDEYEELLQQHLSIFLDKQEKEKIVEEEKIKYKKEREEQRNKEIQKRVEQHAEQVKFWEPRIKFTRVLHNKPNHPYFLPSSTYKEKMERIIAYKEYYNTDFEELKLIFDAKDVENAINFPLEIFSVSS